MLLTEICTSHSSAVCGSRSERLPQSPINLKSTASQDTVRTYVVTLPYVLTHMYLIHLTALVPFRSTIVTVVGLQIDLYHMT